MVIICNHQSIVFIVIIVLTTELDQSSQFGVSQCLSSKTYIYIGITCNHELQHINIRYYRINNHHDWWFINESNMHSYRMLYFFGAQTFDKHLTKCPAAGGYWPWRFWEGPVPPWTRVHCRPAVKDLALCIYIYVGFYIRLIIYRYL